jgi:hypothetical protein
MELFYIISVRMSQSNTADHLRPSHKCLPVTDVLNTQGKMCVQQQNVKKKHEGNNLDKIYICADSILRK